MDKPEGHQSIGCKSRYKRKRTVLEKLKV